MTKITVEGPDKTYVFEGEVNTMDIEPDEKYEYHFSESFAVPYRHDDVRICFNFTRTPDKDHLYTLKTSKNHRVEVLLSSGKKMEFVRPKSIYWYDQDGVLYLSSDDETIATFSSGNWVAVLDA